jgi:PAS domain S-box-containing protein
MHAMNSVFVRNLLIFALLVVSCVLGLLFFTIKSSKNIEEADQWVFHSQAVIRETQGFVDIVLDTTAAQRGYVLDQTEQNLQKFEDKKAELSTKIATIRDLVRDNPNQTSRMTEIEHVALQFKDALDANIQNHNLEDQTLESRVVLATHSDKLRSLSRNILDEEYVLQTKRAVSMNISIRNYKITLMIGGIATALIVLILNAYLMRAQAKVTKAEETLRLSEERFRLAIRGSNDGIFDWDFKTRTIYWSSQYKAMLGYNEDELTGTEETFKSMLHPEDREPFWNSLNSYINGELSEFSAIYRMIHKSGRPIWIHGRGKAIFDQDGHALRFIGAHTDISYLKEHERELKDERDRAEAASAAKGDFLAHMSHEIRTPLTAVSGIAEILSQDEEVQDSRHGKLIRTLRTSTETLKELINDILDFSKIESGELEMEYRHFMLSETFQQVISMMSLKSVEKNLDFVFDYSGVENIEFYGDNMRLRQALINLIGNAIKFTENGRVHVRAYLENVQDSNVLCIDIEDTGIGISDKSMAFIFDKFKQADSSVSRRYGGTGLGLPISKKLVELMGGVIRAKSKPGEGSTFTIILPFLSSGQDNSAEVRDIVKTQKINDRLRAAIGEEKRILLVEDYEGNIVVLTYILGSLDIEYDVAKTGLEALHLWKEKHYDLILMDVQMPEMDGLTATRTIRKMEEERGMENTPIIGLTAHALVADKQKCIDAGMNDYLSKPIVEADLKEAILRILEKQKRSA